jgi:hypothetical protein
MLDGVEIDLPEGFEASGVQEGFFAPTNKDNAEGVPKRKYLTDEPIKRPDFARKPKMPSSGDSSRSAGRPSSRVREESGPPKEKGHPSKHVDQNLPKEFAKHRRDGRFHPSFPTLMENDYCQYCCYKYNHLINIDEVSRNVWMKKNRSRIS